MGYEEQFSRFAPVRDPLFDEPVVLGARIWYKNMLPDLDATHLKDCLQKWAYVNDRSVELEHIVRSLDASSPRSIVVVAPLADWEEVVAFLHDESRYAKYAFRGV